MVGSNSVKSVAKTVLKGNWINAIVTGLVLFLSFFTGYMIFSLSASLLPFAFATLFLILFMVFLISPLTLGVVRNFWHLINLKPENPIYCFYYFSSKKLYLRAVKLIFALTIRMIGHGLILFLPTIIFHIVSGEYLYNFLDIPIPLWTTNFEYIAVFLRTMSIVLLFFVMTKYYAAPVLTVSNDEMDIEEAIYMSKIISKGSLLEFIYLIFSFIGWIYISLFYFPLLFTLPYMLAAFLVYTRFAIEDYNKRISDLEEENSSYSEGV